MLALAALWREYVGWRRIGWKRPLTYFAVWKVHECLTVTLLAKLYYGGLPPAYAWGLHTYVLRKPAFITAYTDRVCLNSAYRLVRRLTDKPKALPSYGMMVCPSVCWQLLDQMLWSGVYAKVVNGVERSNTCDS